MRKCRTAFWNGSISSSTDTYMSNCFSFFDWWRWKYFSNGAKKDRVSSVKCYKKNVLIRHLIISRLLFPLTVRSNVSFLCMSASDSTASETFINWVRTSSSGFTRHVLLVVNYNMMSLNGLQFLAIISTPCTCGRSKLTWSCKSLRLLIFWWSGNVSQEDAALFRSFCAWETKITQFDHFW